MPNKYGKCTRDFGAFLFLFQSTFLYFGGIFNKTIILLALVGHEMIIATVWKQVESWLSLYLPSLESSSDDEPVVRGSCVFSDDEPVVRGSCVSSDDEAVVSGSCVSNDDEPVVRGS